MTPSLPGMAMTDAEVRLIEASLSRASGAVPPAAESRGPDPQAFEMRVIIRATQRPDSTQTVGDDVDVDLAVNAGPADPAPSEPAAGTPT